MDILTALKMSFFGFLVVFVTLGLISLCIKILSGIIMSLDKLKKQSVEVKADNLAEIAGLEAGKYDDVGYGELKLYNVDEKTAAMIMAIVSDESQIPLSELRFKSIRLIEN